MKDKIKSILFRIFGVRKSLLGGLKAALSDSCGVVVGAAVTAFMTLLTYQNPEWMGFLSYIFAVILVIIGFFVSYKYPGGYLSSAAGTSIASFLCVVASVDALKAMSGILIKVAYWETPLKSVPSFIFNKADITSPEKTALISVAMVFVVLLLHKWFDLHRSEFYNKASKADS
ncbi:MULTISPECIES: hypothetical protein [unclassified Halomonas]|uniref:hypothetical protein n=1 Tax=unclassified Halomonas TaxID=2609666 RepID=UPI00288416B4|nr:MULTISPECIES: hypothetical protein [unclassified Halomonas]MDT0502582.1 hypothetical protein [Halomonas sp. PAR7]MDT0592039.1 hypothetical protein [Halomonas sp. PAR8]